MTKYLYYIMHERWALVSILSNGCHTMFELLDVSGTHNHEFHIIKTQILLVLGTPDTRDNEDLGKIYKNFY